MVVNNTQNNNLITLYIKVPQKILAKIFLPKKSCNRKFQTQKNLLINPITLTPKEATPPPPTPQPRAG